MNVPHRGASLFLPPIVLAAALAISTAAFAESLLPLETEEAKPLPSGTVEMVAGMSYFRNLRFPAFTAAGVIHEQDLIEGPEIAFRVGAGDWAEVQASYEFISIDEDTIAGHHDKYGGGDARLHTKVRLLREQGYWPGLGIRFGTKLPNASKDDRLGTDEIDFDIEALVSKDFGPVSTHVNLGIALLGNPGPVLGAPNRSGNGQDDLFTYSVALASRRFSLGFADTSVRLLAEAVGLAGSRGDFDNDRSAGRVGLQVAHGNFTAYAGGSFGFVTASEDYGFSLGLVYALDLWRLIPTPAP
jgi:hypothetical protein